MLSLTLLCGGKSGRMGQDKALMPFLGRSLILRILERLAFSMDEVILSTNHPADYAFLDLPTYPDLLSDCGALGGLYTSLTADQGPTVAAVACDMPFASPTLFEYESELLSKTGAVAVIPSTPQGLEPLHVVYRRETCVPGIRSALKAGSLKLVGWLPHVVVRMVPPEESVRLDPHSLAYWNLNTPEDLQQAEEQARLELN